MMKRNNILKKTLVILMTASISICSAACGDKNQVETSASNVSSISETASTSREVTSTGENSSETSTVISADTSTETPSTDKDSSSSVEEKEVNSNALGLTKADEKFESLEFSYKKTLNMIYELAAAEADINDVPGLYGLDECCISYKGEEFLKNVGYTFIDLNADGQYELLLGEVGDDIIRACYSMVDNFLFEGWARNQMLLIPDEDGSYTIGNISSAGAASTGYGFFKLNAETKKMDCSDFYFTDTVENGDIAVFHNQTGIFDQDKAEKTDMTEEELRDLTGKKLDKSEDINFTPLSAYPYQKIDNTKSYSPARTSAAYFYDMVDLADIEPAYYDETHSGGYTLVLADNTDHAVNLLITPKRDLKDVSFIKYNNIEMDENGEVISFEPEYLDIGIDFKAGQPIMVRMTFFGDIPNYGIVGSELDNSYVFYSLIGLSGEDGSPMYTVYGQNWTDSEEGYTLNPPMNPLE